MKRNWHSLDDTTFSRHFVSITVSHVLVINIIEEEKPIISLLDLFSVDVTSGTLKSVDIVPLKYLTTIR